MRRTQTSVYGCGPSSAASGRQNIHRRNYMLPGLFGFPLSRILPVVWQENSTHRPEFVPYM